MRNFEFIAIVGMVLFLRTGAADDGFSNEVVKSTSLGPSLYMFEGAGGNMTALIGPEGTLLVDDDFAPMGGKITARLTALGGASPRFVVNTHFHYDHTGGNEVFGSTATIIAAAAVRDRLSTEQTLWKKQHPPAPPQALPALTFEQNLTLHLNSEQVRVLHLPRGHTDGDTIVLFSKGHVASLGDLYFAGMYPIFHLEHGGRLDGFVKNLEIVLKLIPDDCKIVPGHGPISTKADLTKYHRMISSSIVTVKRGLKGGRSLEQIQKSGLAPEWEEFSHGYVSTDRWIAMIYAALRK